MRKPSFLLGMLPWLTLPVVIVLGQRARARSPRLLPPPGPLTGAIDGSGAALRLLVLGDSSAAGVGAAHTSECLAPLLAEAMHAKSGRPVFWRMAGANSAIAAELRDHVVPHLPHEAWTHILIAVGTNDAKNYVTVSRFKKGFGGLLYALKSRFPEARIVWSPVIDMRTMPALPVFLGQMLAIRARAINATGAELCRERYGVAADPLPVNDSKGFATDGFHANAAAYHIWARHVLAWLMPDG
jgi:lysophospholipase L1-like esterase